MLTFGVSANKEGEKFTFIRHRRIGFHRRLIPKVLERQSDPKILSAKELDHRL